MKKIIVLMLALLLSLSACFTLTACKKEREDEENPIITPTPDPEPEPEPEPEPAPYSITVKSLVQTVYGYGEDIFYGGTIRLKYSHGVERDIPIKEDMLVTKTAASSGDKQTLEFEHLGSKASFEVALTGSTVTKIETVKFPHKLEYDWNETFDAAGGILKRTYADGKDTQIPMKLSDFDKTKSVKFDAGEDMAYDTVNITGLLNSTAYNSFTIKVFNRPQELTITSNPTKLAYNWSEVLNVAGGKVRAKRLNGDWCTASPIDMKLYMLDCNRAMRPANGSTTVVMPITVTYVVKKKDHTQQYTDVTNGSMENGRITTGLVELDGSNNPIIDPETGLPIPAIGKYLEASATFNITITDPYCFVLVNQPSRVKACSQWAINNNKGTATNQNVNLNYNGLVLAVGHASGNIDDGGLVTFSWGDGKLQAVTPNSETVPGPKVLKFYVTSGIDTAKYGSHFTNAAGVEVVTPPALNPTANTDMNYRYSIVVANA